VVPGIGVDVVDVERMKFALERTPRIRQRLFTEDEIAYCEKFRFAERHYAGRWAAKEAVLKALGTGWRRGIAWRDIEIRNDRNGTPAVHIRGGARDVMERAGIEKMHVTISHCRSFAVAYVVAEGEK
jgi:holo-[acyl-carrier protein] synthase